MRFHLRDLHSVGRGKRTDCDLDDNVEDSGTNDGTSANISLNIETMNCNYHLATLTVCKCSLV